MDKEQQQAKDLLSRAGVFYDEDLDQTLNMNDTFGWGTAFGEDVADEELTEVLRLHQMYGYHGLNYWVSEKHNQMDSEFFDVTRGIHFVRHEEKLIESEKSCSDRAYSNLRYSLGKPWVVYLFIRIGWKLRNLKWKLRRIIRH